MYQKYCSSCHQKDGRGLKKIVPPLAGSKIATSEISNHVKTVLYGIKQTAMKAFGEELNDEEIAAIITYERNAWGNNNTNKYGKFAGGDLQANDVKKMRKG